MRHIDYRITYIVYAWLLEDGTPYYLSKCRDGSEAPYKTRMGGLQPPADRNNIKILLKTENEKHALEFLDKSQYTIGLADATGGVMPLRNSIHQSPRALGDKPHPNKTPVTVFTTEGEKVGNFDSIGDACHCLKLNKGNARQVLIGNFWQTEGYCIVERGKHFKERKGTCAKRRLWSKRQINAYDGEGNLHTFVSIADAAETIFQNRKKTSGIQKSLKSEVKWKSRIKGWCFFEEGKTPLLQEIRFASAGRPKQNHILEKGNEC